MKDLDVRSLYLGPKVTAWTLSVLGNLARLSTDQSIPEESRQSLKEIRILIFDILDKNHLDGEWIIRFIPD